MITYPDPSHVNIMWAHDHQLYLRRGRFSFFGDTPKSLLQIWMTERAYWFEHIVGPVNDENWKGPIERAIIELLASNPDDMVRLVAQYFPPPEDVCVGFGVEEGECSCMICDRVFSDELLDELMWEALADEQADIDTSSRLEDFGDGQDE